MNQTPAVARAGARAGRTLLFAALAASVAAPTGFCLGQFAGGTLDLDVRGMVTSDSNVFGDRTNENDFFFTLRPELDYKRQGTRGSTSISGGFATNRYLDFSELDSTDWFVNGAIAMPDNRGGPLSGRVALAFFDGHEADDFIASRVEMRRLTIDAGMKYQLSAKTGLRFGGNTTNYRTDLRPKSESWQLRVGLAQQLRPLMDGFIDFGHGSSNANPAGSTVAGVDYDTNSYNVGVDGQLARTLNGSISVGLSQIAAATGDAGGDADNFSAAVALRWTARATTTVAINGGQQSRITSDADSIDVFSAGIGVNQKLNAALSGNLGFLYEKFEPRGGGQADTRLLVTLELVYSVRDKFGLGGGVQHNTRWSYNPLYDINRTTVNFYSRYTF